MIFPNKYIATSFPEKDEVNNTYTFTVLCGLYDPFIGEDEKSEFYFNSVKGGNLKDEHWFNGKYIVELEPDSWYVCFITGCNRNDFASLKDLRLKYHFKNWISLTNVHGSVKAYIENYIHNMLPCCPIGIISGTSIL